MTNAENNPLLQKCIAFSIAAIRFAEQLEHTQKFVVANQLLRSATSIGACVTEAQSAESRADFIHKLKIADKEAHETLYWLTLCEYAEAYPSPVGLKPLLGEIMKLLNAIISSAKNRSNT